MEKDNKIVELTEEQLMRVSGGSGYYGEAGNTNEDTSNVVLKNNHVICYSCGFQNWIVTPENITISECPGCKSKNIFIAAIVDYQ